MKQRLTGILVVLTVASIGFGQTPIFTEDFEAGTPGDDWALYREGEEPVQAVAASTAPKPLANAGDYIGHVQDADFTYQGAGIALAGTVSDSNYTIEGDVYVYTNHPGGSAYTGLVVYADSSAGVYYKLAADFDADNRFRLYNNRINTTTMQYSFHHAIDASDVDTSEGWHHMIVLVETLEGGYPSFTCYYDGIMIGERAYIDSSSDKLDSGQWGLYAFQMDTDGIAGYFDNVRVTPIFTEDFEAGTPGDDWALYREGEEPVQAVAASTAPKPLANAGDYIGHVQDADFTYQGAGIALAGTVSDSNYTIEGDVYVYTNHPGGSAYTGLVVYADSSAGVYYKLAADFDADNRFRLYNNRINTTTMQYSFHHAIDASDVDTTEGWHHMMVVVETMEGGYPGFTCYYDGVMIGEGTYIDSSSDKLDSGQWGLYAFQMDTDGIAGYFDNVKVYRGGIIPAEEAPVAVEDPTALDANIPVAFSLSQNYPNPFNPSTTIEFQVHLAGETSLDIYDLSGRVINTLVHAYLAPNRYSVVWDGRDTSGRLVPSGIYIYSLTIGIQHEAKRMVFLK